MVKAKIIMHFYIQILLYFFKELSSIDIAQMIKPLVDKRGREFDVIFQTSINLLRKENSIYADKSKYRGRNKELTRYSLSANGYKGIYDMINECDKAKECDRIRKIILYNQFYLVPQS